MERNYKIKLMTHQIIGYPSIQVNCEVLKKFESAGVDMVELQIPFSEPIADGPLFVKSNQMALETGMNVEKAVKFIERVCREFTFEVYVMTYYNIVFKYGEEKFFSTLKDAGVKGVIVPDIPIDQDSDFYETAQKYEVDAVPIVTPFTTRTAIKDMLKFTGGFVYYVPRTGVTGTTTMLSDEMLQKIDEVKKTAEMPIAVGFGIQSKEAVSRLTGHADIAILGSHLQRVMEEKGIKELGNFIADLR